MINLIDTLPTFYSNFLPKKFHIKVAEETISKCSNCVMLQNDDKSHQNASYFNPNTKCCTYHPIIRNYLVGAFLSDESENISVGRDIIIQKIQRRVGVLPDAIHPSNKYSHLYNSSANFFGKTISMVCPFYNNKQGNCFIWKYRSAICTTWFCKPVYGEDGELFWNEVKNYLVYVENVLSTYALLKCGFNILDINIPFTHVEINKPQRILNHEDIDEIVSEEKYKRIWGNYCSNEIEFYKNCYAIIEKISNKDFNKISGVYHDLLLKKVTMQNNKLAKFVLPFYLKKNPNLIIEKSLHNKYIVTYKFQRISLSPELYQILDNFNGILSIQEIRKYLKINFNLTINDDLLKSLYHNRILIEP